MILQMMVINSPVENSMGFSCMEVTMKKWKAILFDMDGTLFDTEQISRIGWQPWSVSICPKVNNLF